MTVFESKKEMKMTNEHMWEKKGTLSGCRCCGNFIKNGENFYLVVILGTEVYKDFPTEGNFIVHKDEFDQLAESLAGDEYAALREIFSNKRKRATNRTPVNEEMTTRFRSIAPKMRLRIVNETKNRIYFKPTGQGKIGDFIFDKRSLEVYYNGRGFNGMFDRIFLREFISKINEELHQEEAGFRAEKFIGEVVDKVDKIYKFN